MGSLYVAASTTTAYVLDGVRSCSCRVHRAEKSITLGRRSFGRGVVFRALTFMYPFSGEIAVMWP